MKLVALLSFYDEGAQWLRDMVASLPKANVTHLVAVDGAYDRYPGGQRQSDDSQHKALIRECKRQRIGLTIHVPDSTWPTEMEKRTHLFRLGETVTTDTDWFLIMDSDEVITQVPADLHVQLQATEHDTAKVTFDEPNPDSRGRRFSIPILFRAMRGITVEGNHYTYRAPDGRDLWGQGRYEPALPLQMEVLHRTHLRPKARKAASKAYYAKRDEDKVEIGRCVRCGDHGAVEIPYDWRLLDEAPSGHDPGMGYLSARWVPVCDTCQPILTVENERTISSFGLDPHKARMTYEIESV